MPRQFSRRDFLKNAAMAGGCVLIQPWMKHVQFQAVGLQNGQKRIYLAPDDHTDYFWSAGESEYRDAFLRMIDYYLDLADSTQANKPEHQSRWNCDGSFWLWTYERNKPQADYDRLISRVKSGHISFPLNALVVCLGGVPAEAVLRGMYYAGQIERREGLRFRMAISMENQTLPLGLASLWAGAGARFSWKGVCGCDSQVPAAGDREHDIYWWEGLDGSRILMKWNSMLQGNQYPGGYAEARYPYAAVNFVDGDPAFQERYPYPIIGVFGKGWDDVETLTDEFVNIAQTESNTTRQVIVSNEEDFFDDFEANFGTSIPTQSVSFGNEWDLYCAALAETSASVKRSLETLRSAEALATLVTLADPSFMDGRQTARGQAWMALGLFWEHNFGMVGMPIERIQERVAWQRRLSAELGEYVESLARAGGAALGGLIAKQSQNPCFYVFNPLSWVRSDYADFLYEYAGTLHVVDLTTGEQTPAQSVVLNGQTYLRILATDIPALGYKVFEIRTGDGQQEFGGGVSASRHVLENQHFQVTVAENGAILSWKDKRLANRELVKRGGGSVNDFGAGAGSIRIENEGEVSVTLVAESESPLRHMSRITLFKDLARIDIQNEILQNFDATQTWVFGFDLEQPNVWHEEVGAIVNARLQPDGGHYSPRDINARYDWLTLNHFVDMTAGEVGVTLSNADCYFMRLGNSSAAQLDSSTPQIAVLAGGRVVGMGAGIYDQGGAERFLQRFALTSHAAYHPGFAMRFALEHQNPFVTGEVQGGTQYPDGRYSFLKIDNPNVLLWVLKPAEDGLDAGTIVRVWNVSQEPQIFSLRVAGQIIKAMQLSHIETPLAAATVQAGALIDSLTAQQMKTYAIFIGEVDAVVLTPDAATPVSSASATRPPIPTTPVVDPNTPPGRGCLLEALGSLFSLFR